MMANTRCTGKTHAGSDLNYDRKTELKAFDDTKAGVKGLVDSGLSKVPRIFINHQPNNQNSADSNNIELKHSIPVIDLGGINNDTSGRVEAVERVREACERWGFFQVVNHGIEKSVMEEMIERVRRFNEQETEVKKRFYTRDVMRKKVLFNTNFDLFSASSANWRDTLSCIMAPHPPHPEELPEICRDGEYTDRRETESNQREGVPILEKKGEIGFRSWRRRGSDLGGGGFDLGGEGEIGFRSYALFGLCSV
ncbi:hypothetical protein LOK49_LG03G01134 [Camellia lanceoleosa]|uniref:Uncharacterized protein n=1 Tax=Camellia lanceoleosa TaxID=1840588 RepID=A0ACC0IFJ5_9ERIC|nr:hypothetical protein LOK49_LG03G01134 [Camellia lanceoleosa]